MRTRIFVSLLILWVILGYFQDEFQNNLVEKAESYLQKEDYLGALVYYNYLSKTKADVYNQTQRIHCLLMLKKLAQAEEAIVKLYEQQISHASVYQLHARLLAEQGDTAGANAKYFQAIHAAENDSIKSAYSIQAAKLNLYAKNFARADSLLADIHHSAFAGLSYYYRGVALRFMVDHVPENEQKSTLTQAQNMLFRSIEIDSTFADNWFQLAMIEAWLKNADACLAYLNQALKFDPDNLYYLLMKGNVYRSLMQCNTALEIYERILQLHPRYELALEERALLHETCFNNPQAAEADRTKLLHIKKLRKTKP